MKSKVWFSAISDGETPESVAARTVKLASVAGLADIVRKDGLTGILQHVGEGRGVGYIKAPVTSAVAKAVRKHGGKPFLTGSATLYKGSRSNAVDHIMQAYAHGFVPENAGCPIIMCDGLRGADRVEVKVPGARHCKTAYLGSAVSLMDSLVVVTHPTGHIEAGYAASVKNVAMGLSSRGGKLAMHHGTYPVFNAEACTACGQCVKWCPANAIVMEKKARLLKEKCIGCGQCYTVCAFDAIDFDWGVSGPRFQEMLVEYCVAAKTALRDRVLYINVVQHFQEGCDCIGTPQEAICKDLGIVASRDIVAVDVATAELLTKKLGRDIAKDATGIEYRGMLDYAQSVGLGSVDYDLVEV